MTPGEPLPEHDRPAADPPAADGFERELAFAVRLAREAGDIIKTFYEVPPRVRYKDPTEPVTEADRAVNAFLARQIGLAYPEDGQLCEESKDAAARLQKRRVWIVDPLDGTAEFVAHNGEFCIMIGLAVDAEPVVGVVYQPVDELLYAAGRGGGAYMERFGDRSRLQVSATSELRDFRLVVSRTHRVPLVSEIGRALGIATERRMGSVGLKTGLIARGQAEVYVHPNAGTKEWDTCAPEIILREAGGAFTDCWNRPLRYNQRDVIRRFGVLASNGTRHAGLSERIARVLDVAGVEPDFGF